MGTSSRTRLQLFFYYALKQDANYWVSIDDVVDLKIQAVTKHVSQFQPSVSKYRWVGHGLQKLVTELNRAPKGQTLCGGLSVSHRIQSTVIVTLLSRYLPVTVLWASSSVGRAQRSQRRGRGSIPFSSTNVIHKPSSTNPHLTIES